MAAFKVGQRVRMRNYVAKWHSTLNGREATVVGFLGQEYLVDVDGIGPMTPHWGPITAKERHMSPLTDPGAESFIARIKKLGSEPINDAPKVTAREGK